MLNLQRYPLKNTIQSNQFSKKTLWISHTNLIKPDNTLKGTVVNRICPPIYVRSLKIRSSVQQTRMLSSSGLRGSLGKPLVLFYFLRELQFKTINFRIEKKVNMTSR